MEAERLEGEKEKSNRKDSHVRWKGYPDLFWLHLPFYLWQKIKRQWENIRDSVHEKKKGRQERFLIRRARKSKTIT